MMPRSLPPRLRDPIVWEALAWLVAMAGAYRLTSPFAAPMPFNPLGPAFWPRLVIVLVAIAAGVLLLSRFLSGDRQETRHDAFLEEAPPDPGSAGWRTAALFITPLIWVFAMHHVGFLIATPLFLAAFTWLMGVRRPGPLLGFAVLFHVAIVAIFYGLIFTPLPMGAGYFYTLSGKFLGLIQ